MRSSASIRACRWTAVSIAALAVVIAAGGCGKPSRANIELRKQNSALRDEVAALRVARQGDAASIRALEERKGTSPTLPQDRLERLFTVHGLNLGRLTGGADLDPARPGDEGLKVYAVPTDAQGDLLKASGAFVVEAFDLSRGSDAFLGKWEFDTAQARDLWSGGGLMYGYVLTCPWQETLPTTGRLLVHVVFVDELTGRSVEAQTRVRIKPPVPSEASSPIDR